MSKSRQLSDAINSVDISESAPADAVTLDSSGNLLVGTTSAGNSDTGVEAWNDGLLQATRDGNTTLRVNRKTSDGTIIDLQKDGSTVGSIGAKGGLPYFAYPSGAGIKPSSTEILPAYGSNGSSADNTYDLGSSSARFKDLYLSGGVYLGGTGSANYLDDYEEGTWTPTYTAGFSSVTYSSQYGLYTKIGNIVHFMLLLNSLAATRLGGIINITLPFTSQSGLAHAGGGSFAYVNGDLISSTSTNLPTVYIGSNNSVLALYKTDGNTFTGNDSATATPQMYIVGSYLV